MIYTHAFTQKPQFSAQTKFSNQQRYCSPTYEISLPETGYLLSARSFAVDKLAVCQV